MLRTLRGHSNSVLAVQFDSRIIVSGSEDHTVRVWSSTEGQLYVEVIQYSNCWLWRSTGSRPTAPSLLCDVDSEEVRESFHFSQRTSYQYNMHQRRRGALTPKFPTVSQHAYTGGPRGGGYMPAPGQQIHCLWLLRQVCASWKATVAYNDFFFRLGVGCLTLAANPGLQNHTHLVSRHSGCYPDVVWPPR
jgi:hypothetical protein